MVERVHPARLRVNSALRGSSTNKRMRTPCHVLRFNSTLRYKFENNHLHLYMRLHAEHETETKDFVGVLIISRRKQSQVNS